MFCCFVCNSFFELVSEKLTSNGEWVASPPQPSESVEEYWLDWNGSKWEPQRSPNTAAISSPAQLSPKLSREATIWASTPFNSCLFLAWPSCQCQLDCTSTSCLFLAKGTKEFLNLDSAWTMLGVDKNYTFSHVSHFYVKSPCQSQ